MLDATPVGVHFWDKSLKMYDCNQAAIKLFDLSDKQEYMDNFSQLSPERQPDGILSSEAAGEHIKKAFSEGYERFEWTHQKLSGESIPCEITLVRVYYHSDSFVAAYIRDLREQKKAQSELANALELAETHRVEAETANKAKSAFLSTMSHEIRTPMNAILGITEIQLQNESMDSEITGAFEKIYTSSVLLLGIINDILDLSKIEAGKLELIVSKYETASMISDTVQLNMMRAGSKVLDFELNVDENTPSAVLGDELRVKQILNNLLSNAFKYTDAGKIKMSVNAEPIDGKDDEFIMVVVISDTGQGMTEEQISKLYDTYSRFNMEANRTTEGTGLGMNITNNLVRLMNGEITVESEPGKGSVFTIRVPQGKAGPKVLGREMAENLQAFRTSSSAHFNRVKINREPMPYGSILVVDDVETNIFVAKGLMSPYGIKIDSADSGFVAIEKVKNGNVYDIIFMDHMMPKMDGVETTKIIRGMGYEPPIVALTANAVAGQADVFLGNGFTDFISKPIDLRQLNTVLNKYIRDKHPPEVVKAARKEAAVKIAEKHKDNVKHNLDEIILRDISKALVILEDISLRNDYENDDDLQAYTINVHGMKSALANYGETGLSAAAAELEKAAREKDFGVIASGTPAFLSSLRAMKEKLTPKESSVDCADEDTSLLDDKLNAIIAACKEYDESAADEVLAELKKNLWSQKTKTLLDSISENLLHSDFDEIVENITRFRG